MGDVIPTINPPILCDDLPLTVTGFWSCPGWGDAQGTLDQGDPETCNYGGWTIGDIAGWIWLTCSFDEIEHTVRIQAGDFIGGICSYCDAVAQFGEIFTCTTAFGCVYLITL
jgi:hypothetical protein